MGSGFSFAQDFRRSRRTRINSLHNQIEYGQVFMEGRGFVNNEEINGGFVGVESAGQFGSGICAG